MMQGQTNLQISHHSIIDLGEQLYLLVKNMDMVEFEKKLPEYTKQIEDHFTDINKYKLIQSDIDNLEKVLNQHQKITCLINKHKNTISKKLKQLHAGKAMQMLYPPK